MANNSGLYICLGRARGDYNVDSDVDVLIVLSDFKKYGAELRRTGELVGKISLDHDETVSVVFSREQEWKHDNLPLLMNIRAESIAV
jgi:predicted nucleotidyltransferase